MEKLAAVEVPTYACPCKVHLDNEMIVVHWLMILQHQFPIMIIFNGFCIGFYRDLI